MSSAADRRRKLIPEDWLIVSLGLAILVLSITLLKAINDISALHDYVQDLERYLDSPRPVPTSTVQPVPMPTPSLTSAPPVTCTCPPRPRFPPESSSPSPSKSPRPSPKPSPTATRPQLICVFDICV